MKETFEQYIVDNQKKNPLIKRAFVHTSYKNIRPHYETNETLEMIGDKILDLILYEYHYSLSDGKISKVELDGFRQQKTTEEGLANVFDYYNLEVIVFEVIPQIARCPMSSLSFSFEIHANQERKRRYPERTFFQEN